MPPGPRHGRPANDFRATAPSPSKAKIGVVNCDVCMVTSVVQESPLTSVHQGMRQFPTCKERAGPSAVPIIVRRGPYARGTRSHGAPRETRG